MKQKRIVFTDDLIDANFVPDRPGTILIIRKISEGGVQRRSPFSYQEAKPVHKPRIVSMDGCDKG